jgi:tetratricopeptide (TPR) repeat protein
MSMPGPYDPYLRQARALFAAGDVVKAGQIWQAILKKDPGNAEARTGLYKVKAHFDARATQDGPAGAAPPSPRGDKETLTPSTPEINTLLEAGCTLYDAGLLEKAISTWEMALHQDPDNALAKGYIDGARRVLEAGKAKAAPEAPAAPAPAPAPVPEPAEAEVIDRLLRDGCTLYDMGQIEDALRKWEQILARDPGHALATDYANDARRELGLPPLATGPSPASHPAPAEKAPRGFPPPVADGLSRASQLVREGVQIYDMGMVDEAIAKWERALALEPDHADARGYLAMARRDRKAASPAAPRPAASRPGPPDLGPRLAAAENLLRHHQLEEAVFAFQQLLENDPQDPRILQGFQQARTLLAAREAPAPETPAIAIQTQPAPRPHAHVPAQPPQALTAKPVGRRNMNLQGFLGRLHLPPWLENPRRVFVAASVLLVLVALYGAFHSWQRDVALRQAVAAAKASALAPAAKRGDDIPLSQGASEVRQEGEHALGEDPLTAYYRAQECLRLDPGDALAAQLMDRAKTRLGGLPPTGAGLDVDQAMKNGNLDGAHSAVLDQLHLTPDDADLKGKARILTLALVRRHVMNDHFQEARDLLLRGRAMFPQDRTWPSRIRLLEDIQRMPKAARANWIPLLD